MKQRVTSEDYSEWKSAVGLAIGARRQRLGRSIEDVAEKAQLSPELLDSIEGGAGHLTLQQLYRLCRALDASMSQLLLETGPTSAAADTREFIDAYNQIKDPQLKDQISALVSAMIAQSPRNQSHN